MWNKHSFQLCTRATEKYKPILLMESRELCTSSLPSHLDPAAARIPLFPPILWSIHRYGGGFGCQNRIYRHYYHDQNGGGGAVCGEVGVKVS